jgi:hypothetical protein
MIDSAWTDWANRAAPLPRPEQSAFYKRRFDLLFAPAVAVMLGGACLLSGADPFGPSAGGKERTSGLNAVDAGALSQADGAPSRQPRTPARAAPPPPPPPPPPHPPIWSLPPPPPPPPSAAALHWLSSPFGFTAPAAAPALQPPPPTPPPPYIPPVVKVEPRSSSATRAGGTKQVQFASPPATTVAGGATGPSTSRHGALDRDSDGLGALYPAEKSFVGKSASAYLSGPRSVRNIPFKKDRNGGADQPGPPCTSRTCEGLNAGYHASWNCPLRFWAVRGMCPGFLPNGARDPAAWNGDEITDATRAQWKSFDQSLRLAMSSPGPPSFD